MNKQRVNRKICPRCLGKHTRKASKLGYYSDCMFCLDCAIYYNRYVSEEKNITLNELRVSEIINE